MRIRRRDDDLTRLERELRALRAEPSRDLVRRLARGTGERRAWLGMRPRLALVAVLTAAVLAAAMSANVTSLTVTSTHHFVKVVKHLTGTEPPRSLQAGPPGPPGPGPAGPGSPAADQYAGQCGSPPRVQCVIEVDPDKPHVTEGNTGQTAIILELTIKDATRKPFADCSVAWQLVDGTATLADNDYGPPTSGTATIPANSSGTTVTVNINGDYKVEPDEKFRIVWTPASSCAVMDGDDQFNEITIKNDDKTPKVKVDPGNQSVDEGNTGTKTVTYNVSLDQPSDGSVSVSYATGAGPDHTATGGASCAAGIDYVTTSGTISFAAGDQGPHPVTVTICGDTTVETDEKFNLNFALVAGSNATIDNPTKLRTTTIHNDDHPV